MGRKPANPEKNIYQKTRVELGYSVMDAADVITQSYTEYQMTDYHLTRIENGTVAIQPIDVVAMSKGYNKPELRNYYCTNECPIGCMDVPRVSLDKSVHEILINMAVTLERLNEDKIRLMEILSDGKVATDESDDFLLISAMNSINNIEIILGNLLGEKGE